MFKGTIRRLASRDIGGVEKIFDLYWSGDFRAHLSSRLRTDSDDFKWFVAEENGEIVGVAASREASEHMRAHAKTDRVVEFYVAAAKYKGKGIGTALRDERITEAKIDGYKEAVFFSGDTHQDSWAFHDHSDFARVSEATAPNGEHGYIWSLIF